MSSAEKNYEIHDKELLAVYRPGDKVVNPMLSPEGQTCNQLVKSRITIGPHDLDGVHSMKGLKDLVKIFQPLDQELQEIHRKKPFELKDDLWYSGGRLVIPKVIMPGRTNNRHSRSAKEPLATPDRPWGSISLDFIEGLPPSKKYDSKTYDSILVIDPTQFRNGPPYHHFQMRTLT
ncbi:hypothetical protein NDA11_005886 [Ustilago hordei]|nr:hypothetical protein NDA11_005886 [Ustilago hordei]